MAYKNIYFIYVYNKKLFGFVFMREYLIVTMCDNCIKNKKVRNTKIKIILIQISHF